VPNPHINFEIRNSKTAKAFGFETEFNMSVNKSTGRTSFERVPGPVKIRKLSDEEFLEEYSKGCVLDFDNIPF